MFNDTIREIIPYSYYSNKYYCRGIIDGLRMFTICLGLLGFVARMIRGVCCMVVGDMWFLRQGVAFSHFYFSNLFSSSVTSSLSLFYNLLKSTTLLNLALTFMVNFNIEYLTFETIDDT